jgi:ABC-type Mn2+/Zn2+ transport system ATPase subunit
MSLMIETAGLTKRFGDRAVVDDVDLHVPRGCAFGYLGPNGAGKTTLIRMLLGLTASTAGTMHLLGRPVPAERAAAAHTPGSTARSRGSVSASAPTTASGSTRSACASGSASPAACSPTRSC